MNPQALNRYSYVLNNPLKYTDPTGYYDFKKAVAGALIIIGVELPVVIFGVISIFQPQLLPAFFSFVPQYELVTAPASALGLYLIIQGLSEDTVEPNSPELHLEPEQSTPDSSFPVTFSDGSSGYFTPEEVGAMMEEGAPIVSID